MSLMLLFKPRLTDVGGLVDAIYDGYKRKKPLEIEVPAKDVIESLDIPLAKPLITLADFEGEYLDLESPSFKKKMALLAEEEQAILLMIMLDE